VPIRRSLAGGLLLGFLVRVQVAEDVLVHEPLGIEVLDLEAGELRAQSLPQVVPRALGDLAKVAEGAQLDPDIGQPRPLLVPVEPAAGRRRAGLAIA
jgi:hypothetical protein